MSSVLLAKNFSSDKISISAPRALDNGSKQCYFNYDGGKVLLQSASHMSLPFGLSTYDKSGPVEHSVELSFKGHDSKQDLKEFYDAMTAIDNKMIDEAVKHSKLWFKSELNREVIKAFYTPIVRVGKDKDGNPSSYPPTIKLKLRKVNGDFETDFYDMRRNQYKGVPVKDLLVKGASVTALIEFGGVWISGTKFGLTLRAKQIVIHKLPEKLQGFAFKLADNQEDDENEETEEQSNMIEDDEELAPPAKQSVMSAVMPQESMHNTVDDEEADDIEPVPAPKKPIVKKKVVVAAKK
jgi:hypothetical protein